VQPERPDSLIPKKTITERANLVDHARRVRHKIELLVIGLILIVILLIYIFVIKEVNGKAKTSMHQLQNVNRSRSILRAVLAEESFVAYGWL
jgi:hypothetical protein